MTGPTFPDTMTIKPGTKLYIATPAYGGMLHVGYVHSLMRTNVYLAAAGIEALHAFIPGDSLVQRARNVLVAQFMASDCTHFFFADGDIQWDPESIARLLAATMYDDVEVACGVYPKKMLPVEFPVNFAGSSEKLNQHPDIGFIEIKDAPTGFLMIRRDAFVRMMEAYPERKCTLRQDSVPLESKYEYALFDCFIDSDGRYLSEDYGFSRLWQRIGGKVWMDPEIRLIHHGQFAYAGKIADILVPADGSSRPTAAEDIQGWMTDLELEWLRRTASRMSSIVEIGCWKGRSTYALLSACKGKVYAVDHWQGSESERDGPHLEAVTGDVFSEFCRNVGHFKNLEIVKKPSVVAAKDVPEADFVFIDAGHTYADVVSDIRAWKGKARRILAGHDANYPEVYRAVTDELGEVQLGAGAIWYQEVA